MPPYPTVQFPVADKNGVTKAIMHERMVELGNEQVRSIDIIRWRKKGYIPTLAPEPMSFFSATRDNLLPFPTAELDNNPLFNRTNNPGY